MRDPLVSVVLPTYNRADLLPRAIDSVVAQTVHDWEIIVVDDGSTDDTEAVATGYAQRLGQRLRVIRQPNSGAGEARNRGIDSARGQFIAFLDSDDEYMPHKLERQLGLFAMGRDLGFVFSDMAFIDLEGIRHESAFAFDPTVVRQVPTHYLGDGYHVCWPNFLDYVLRRYFIPTIVGMVRRDVLGDSLRWSRGHTYAEEWLFFARVASACRAGYVDEPLSLHHHVKNSITRTDPHRNNLRLRTLLREMRGALTGLTPRQRRAIRTNLARTCRQLGFDAYRRARYAAACRHFAEAFLTSPTLRTLSHTAQAALRAVLPLSASNAQPTVLPQDATGAVR